jgi:enoyl-CoA hydratase/carnithine racemase
MSDVTIEDAGAIRTVTLNRPERLNALNEETRRNLQAVVDELRERGDIRVLVIAGAGPHFSAGADLKDRPLAPSATDDPRLGSKRWQRLLEDLERIPQATIASIHGHVIGGAALLATTCDLRVAASDLAFRIPEVNLGIPLTWGGIPRLAREIGLPRTRELVMTGRSVGAGEARAWGLVHRVVDPGELGRATAELAAELINQPAEALAMTVDALRALGRAVQGGELSWADGDLLRHSLHNISRAAEPADGDG